MIPVTADKKTLYQVLNVEQTAAAAEVKAAFHQCALRTHPDKGGDVKSFRAVLEAFETLSCPTSRAAYDKTLSKKVCTAREDSAASSSGDEGKRWRAKGETLYIQFNSVCRRLHAVLVQLDQQKKAQCVKAMSSDAKARFKSYVQRTRTTKVGGPKVVDTVAPGLREQDDSGAEEVYSDSSSDAEQDCFRAERAWVKGANGRRCPSDHDIRGIRKTFRMVDDSVVVHYKAEVRVRNLTIRSQDTPELERALQWLDAFLEVRNQVQAVPVSRVPEALSAALKAALPQSLLDTAGPTFIVYMTLFDAKIAFAKVAKDWQKAFDAWQVLEGLKESQTGWEPFVDAVVEAVKESDNEKLAAEMQRTLDGVFARAQEAGSRAVEGTLARWRKRRLAAERRLEIAHAILAELHSLSEAISKAEERRKLERRKWQEISIASAKEGARKRDRDERSGTLEAMRVAQKRMLSQAKVDVQKELQAASTWA